MYFSDFVSFCFISSFSAWGNLQSQSIARQQELENALLRLGQFREALSELLTWITECTEKLEKKNEPGIDVEHLEQQMNDLKVGKEEKNIIYIYTLDHVYVYMYMYISCLACTHTCMFACMYIPLSFRRNLEFNMPLNILMCAFITS